MSERRKGEGRKEGREAIGVGVGVGDVYASMRVESESRTSIYFWGLSFAGKDTHHTGFGRESEEEIVD